MDTTSHISRRWRPLGGCSARTTTSSARGWRWMRPSCVGGEGRHGCEHVKEKTRSCRASSVIINVGPSAADVDDDNENVRYHPRDRYDFWNTIITYVSFIVVHTPRVRLFNRGYSIVFVGHWVLAHTVFSSNTAINL